MTRFQALYVAFLRHDHFCNGSWRWVAAKYAQRYEEKIPFSFTMTIGGNQIDGIVLTQEAEKILNIKLN